MYFDYSSSQMNMHCSRKRRSCVKQLMLANRYQQSFVTRRLNLDIKSSSRILKLRFRGTRSTTSINALANQIHV